MKKRMNFRLSVQACEILERLSDERNMTATAIVELALQELAREPVKKPVVIEHAASGSPKPSQPSTRPGTSSVLKREVIVPEWKQDRDA